MKKPEDITRDDLLWALKYAQEAVDEHHGRPISEEELDDDDRWTDDYVRFWYITQALGFTEGV